MLDDSAKTDHRTSAASTGSSKIDTIHIPGQVGSTQSGVVPGDYESQLHLALLNLRKTLFKLRLAIDDITDLILQIIDYHASAQLHGRHVQKFLGSRHPKVTVIPVEHLARPEWLIEIQAVVSVKSTAIPENDISIPTSTTSALTASKASQNDADVIVVGAGLSGLIAARELVRAGLSCIVLEARDRVGGKTWSQKLPNSDAGMVDVGAAWINDTNQSRMFQLAREFGAELIEQNTTGRCMFQDIEGRCSSFAYGELPDFSAPVRENVAYIRDLVEAECQTLDPHRPVHPTYDSMTFEAYIRSHGATREACEVVATWTRAMLGQEPRDVSALYFLNYCKAGGGLLTMRSDRKDGGQYLRIRQGTQFFSYKLAECLPKDTIRMSVVVKAINRQTSEQVEVVTSTGGRFRAKKVVLSMPSPCYSSINFNPPLPEPAALLAMSSTYGYYTKEMLVFQTPFWVQKGFCGLSQSFCGPIAVTRDSSIPQDNKWVLTCFLCGDPGRLWSQIPSEEEQIGALLKQIAQIFLGGDVETVREQYVQHLGHEWTTEEFSGWGCPCVSMPPGLLGAYGEKVALPAGSVHFVGTETSSYWKGYMEGAVRSGERGAAEVIHDLAKTSE